MKKPAKEIKEGEKINLAGKDCTVKKIELSELGKHGKRKVRILAQTPSGEEIVVIRPEDYPIDAE